MNITNASGTKDEQITAASSTAKEKNTYRVLYKFEMEVEFEVEAINEEHAICKASFWNDKFNCCESDGCCPVGEYYDYGGKLHNDENEMYWEIRDIAPVTHMKISQLQPE